MTGMGCDRGGDSRRLTRGREDEEEGLASDDVESRKARSTSDLWEVDGSGKRSGSGRERSDRGRPGRRDFEREDEGGGGETSVESGGEWTVLAHW
jgi:hypothetical protein